MANIIDSLKGFISPELVNQASSSLGESKAGITSALGSAFPSILGGIMNKSSDSSLMKNIYIMAKGQANFPPINSTQLANERGEKGGLIDSGRNLLFSLFGNNTNNLADELSKSSGVKLTSALSLLTLAGPMVLGFLGNIAKTEGMDAVGLTSYLRSQKDNIVNALPIGLRNLIGIKNPVINNPIGNKPAVEPVGEHLEPIEERRRATVQREPVRARASWAKWLVGAIVVLLLFIVGVGFAKHIKHNREMKKEREMMMNRPSVTSTNLTKPAPNVSDATAVTVVLPDGVRLSLPQNSVENKFLMYVQDKSEPISKDSKFAMEGITFEKNSAKLQPGSETQLKNVAAIMNAYPLTAIVVVGSTDGSGNLKLSKERANVVKNELMNMGVNRNAIITEDEDNTSGSDRIKKKSVDIRVIKK